MFSSFWQQRKKKIGTWSAFFIIWSFLIEILLWAALFVAAVVAPSLNLAPVADLLAATGIPLLLCCIGIALSRKWGKLAASLIRLTPLIVVLSGAGVGALMLANAATTTIFSHALIDLVLTAVVLVGFLVTLLLSLAGGKSLWEAWYLW